MRTEYDLVILGGGCAGLSLARELAASSWGVLEVLILEVRSEYVNDRTWCFWGLDQSELADARSQPPIHQWHVLRIRNGSNEVLFPCDMQPYQMLPADLFYRDAIQVIDHASNIDLRLGQYVTNVRRNSNGNWEVSTTTSVFRAKNIVDTRADSSILGLEAHLWQSFYGYEIACSVPVFDPQCADLMDFVSSQTDVSFVYVLPTTPNTALIEFTVFGPAPLGAVTLKPLLENAIKERTAGADYTILRSECAILPMGLKTQCAFDQDGYVKVGLMAGAARASTGYAFQRIQHWSRLCADSLAQLGRPLGNIPDPWIVRAMDRLFLAVLASAPERGAELFVTLFKRADPQSLIRFLSGEAKTADYLNVVLALPPFPFCRAIITAVFERHPTLQKRRK